MVAGRVSLALPAPGDLVGLGGPASFNVAATDAGEAVVAGSFGLVPEVDARTVVWRAYPADRVPWVDERETATELKVALADVTRRLVDLDVAAWQPDIPDLLLNLRHRPPLPLPPGYDARRVETAERAVLCLDIIELARSGRRWSGHGVRDGAPAAPPSTTSNARPAGHSWAPAPRAATEAG